MDRRLRIGRHRGGGRCPLRSWRTHLCRLQVARRRGLCDRRVVYPRTGASGRRSGARRHDRMSHAQRTVQLQDGRRPAHTGLCRSRYVPGADRGADASRSSCDPGRPFAWRKAHGRRPFPETPTEWRRGSPPARSGCLGRRSRASFSGATPGFDGNQHCADDRRQSARTVRFASHALFVTRVGLSSVHFPKPRSRRVRNTVPHVVRGSFSGVHPNQAALRVRWSSRPIPQSVRPGSGSPRSRRAQSPRGERTRVRE